MTLNKLSHKSGHQPGHDNLRAAEPTSDPVIEAAVSRALGRHPAVQIRPGFAAEVARRAAAQPLPSPSAWSGWGPRIAAASGVALTLAMFAFAPHAVPNLGNARFDAEILLFAELGTIALFSNRLLSRD